MKATARQKLIDLVARFGRDICEDPQRCEALLRDVCGDQHTREVNLLVVAVKDHAASELATPNGIPAEVLIARLSERLHNNLGLAKDLSRWSVESWAIALGTITDSSERPVADEQLPYPPKQERTKATRSKVRRVSQTAQELPDSLQNPVSQSKPNAV